MDLLIFLSFTRYVGAVLTITSSYCHSYCCCLHHHSCTAVNDLVTAFRLYIVMIDSDSELQGKQLFTHFTPKIRSAFHSQHVGMIIFMTNIVVSRPNENVSAHSW